MNDPDFSKAIEDAAHAAKQREEARAAEAAAREAKRKIAQTAVDSAMTELVRPSIHKALEQMAERNIPAENGSGQDRYGNTILTLRLRTRDYPPALVFTADCKGPEPRITWHEEMENSAREPKRRELEPVTKEAVAALIRDFLMRAM